LSHLGLLRVQVVRESRVRLLGLAQQLGQALGTGQPGQQRQVVEQQAEPPVQEPVLVEGGWTQKQTPRLL